MHLWLADPAFFGGPGQGTRQIIELFVAFGLTALIGIEREIQGKSAGLRTQTIVGTAAALILLVSKYGFLDVLVDGLVVVDPSRVAAQIVAGIGFLGAVEHVVLVYLDHRQPPPLRIDGVALMGDLAFTGQ